MVSEEGVQREEEEEREEKEVEKENQEGRGVMHTCLQTGS